LRKVKNDLNTLLLTLKSKNEKLDEELKREQQWLDEQQHILDTLTGMEEEIKTQDEDISKRVFSELQHEMLKLKTFKKEILSALSEFLDEHFPPPEEKNQKSSEEPAAELITLTEILEILINRIMNKPHEPYVTIRDSFWPPYIELLLRYGIALRHPEDPSRIRLEAFHL
ncbi:CENPK protein, partial [Aegotheles bennettii]|nr:CENPK protein [Aegotheles bennettii]